MGAIYRREMRSYFTTPVGYIFLAVFFFFSGFYFSRCCLYENTSDLTEVFSSMFTICVFLIPLLTMRLLREERKNKTDQLALTAPVSLLGLALGKFLAALSIFATGLSVALLYGLFFAYLGVANWSVIIGYMVGLLLLGASLTAIGMYISSVTENQVVAAVGAISAGLLLIMADAAASMLQSGMLRNLLNTISFRSHYFRFTKGIISLEDAVFFVSVAALFVFATIRTFERRRWR